MGWVGCLLIVPRENPARALLCMVAGPRALAAVTKATREGAPSKDRPY